MPDYTINEFIAFYFKDGQRSEAQLRRAAEGIERHTTYRVCDTWLSPRGQLGILNLCANPPQAEASGWARLKRDWLAAHPRTNRLRVRGDLALIQTGYTTTPERRFELSLREQGGRLVCDDAGGIAAFCLARFGGAEQERLYVWSTRPGLRSIASAETPELIVVGTRPRLVHALARDFGPPSLDRAYLRASLVGWSLGDQTPYEGTTLVSVDAALRIADGKRVLQPHPTPSYQREERIFRRELPLYRDALRAAVEPLRSLQGFELRLSGGKDSRLVAAALFDRGIVPSTVLTHGPEGAPEVAVAQQVAAKLGWNFQRAQPTFAYRGGLLETVRHNLALSDGFFATEPRHLAFPVHSLVDEPGPGLVIGHIELQKGGWAGRTSEGRERQIAIGKGLVGRRRDALVPELGEAAARHVDEYVAQLSPADEADFGYWINYRFRVCRWLTSHYLSHSKQQLPVYPLVDEKVTRVVSCAPLWHLVSERLLAETTWSLAPSLREVPLFGKPYRFITQREDKAKRERARARKAQPAATAAPQPTSEAAPPAPPPEAPAASAPPPDRRPFAPRALEASAYIRASKVRDELRELTLPAAWALIEEPTNERARASNLEQQVLEQLFWTYYQAAVLYTDGLDSW